jgi:hypothetical protein
MNMDHFGMDTITLAGPLEAKLRAIREAGFAQVMLNAGDLVGHPGGEEAAVREVRESGLRVTGFQVLRDFEGLSGHLHAYKLDVAKAMLQMSRALGTRLLFAISASGFTIASFLCGNGQQKTEPNRPVPTSPAPPRKDDRIVSAAVSLERSVLRAVPLDGHLPRRAIGLQPNSEFWITADDRSLGQLMSSEERLQQHKRIRQPDDVERTRRIVVDDGCRFGDRGRQWCGGSHEGRGSQ